MLILCSCFVYTCVLRTEIDQEHTWGETVRRDDFRLDVALMLMQRDLNYTEAFARFCWSDSSPQGPFDFLMWKELCVRCRDLVTVSQAIHYLQQSIGGVLTTRMKTKFRLECSTAEPR